MIIVTDPGYHPGQNNSDLRKHGEQVIPMKNSCMLEESKYCTLVWWWFRGLKWVSVGNVMLSGVGWGLRGTRQGCGALDGGPIVDMSLQSSRFVFESIINGSKFLNPNF